MRHPMRLAKWGLPTALILLYAAQRLWAAASGRVLLDSDEAILGIMAIDVLHGRPRAFFYGQDYMGSFQALFAAPLLLVAGATPMAMRLAAILEGIGALLCWRWILGRWGARNVWPVLALLMAFGSEFMTVWTLRTRGGYVETLFLGSVWLCLLTSVAQARRRESAPTLARWFLLGAATGAAWWTCQLAVFFFVPGLLFAALQPRARRWLRLTPPGPRSTLRETVAWGAAALYGIAFVLLIARGTVPHGSPASAWLFDRRAALIAFHAAAFVLFLVVAFRCRASLWPAAFGLGAIAGYMPALWVALTRADLYNTMGEMRPGEFLVNVWGFLLVSSGSMVGLLDSRLQPLGIPAPLVVAAAAVYLCAILMLYARIVGSRLRRRRVARVVFFPALAIPASVALLGLPQGNMTGEPYYALFAGFFLYLALAWFIAELARLSRPFAAALLLLVVGVNCFSVARRPAGNVVPWTAVERNDQALIDFLLENDIHVAAASLGSQTEGYWYAYRLTFASGERLRVHPIHHMPRIDRYRLELRGADRCAVIAAADARDVEGAFKRFDVAFRTRRFGDLTVFWDFDKRRVDALGLIEYRRTIDGE